MIFELGIWSFCSLPGQRTSTKDKEQTLFRPLDVTPFRRIHSDPISFIDEWRH
jgi:hypothetical protein